MRIKPPNDGEREKDRNVKKVSSDTVSVGDRVLKFDSVLDSKANQVKFLSFYLFLYNLFCGRFGIKSCTSYVYLVVC